jgi:phosphoribosylglycinamide formyltransferase
MTTHTFSARAASSHAASASYSSADSHRLHRHHSRRLTHGRRPIRASRGRTATVVRASAAKKDPANLAVFVSGGGSNMRAIHAACEDGRVDGRIAVVVTNATDCGGATWARERGIPVLIYPPKKTDTNGMKADELVDALTREHAAKFVLLAGYLRLIPPELCRAYEDAMVNIHPALLPAFGGKGMHGENVHRAVVASGVRYSGPTIHFVNEEFDKGKIIAQTAVPVFHSDDASAVAARVLEQEHLLFPRVVAALCDDRVRFRDVDGVPYIIDDDA